MCGIAGVIEARGRPELAALERAAGLLRHRGPDDSGVYAEGRAGLAHTRLSIIDLEGGHQPIVSPDGRYALIVNGEIYNYRELRKTLIQSGCRFATDSDSEVILHLVATQGVTGLTQLNGMFAFALFDRDDDTLLLCRDRLGIKPLFVARLADRVVFASELKALVALLPRRPDVSPQALAEFCHNQFNTGRHTILEGVERLSPGHYLQIGPDNQLQDSPYWMLQDIAPWHGTLDEAGEAFEDLFAQVLTEHQRADVPYGLFLSGGLDSASILASLSPVTQYRLRTYSVGFAADTGGEVQAAEAIARRFDTDHTTLTLSPEALRGRIVQNVWACDDLMRDYAVLPTLAMSERAARDLKVVFTGEGGDEVFAGYGRYRQHAPVRWLKNLIHSGSGGFRTRSQVASSWNAVAGPRLRDPAVDFRRPFTSAWREAPPDWSYLRKSQYTDIETALPDNLLVKVDRATMAFGLEARVPLLDHRIVEFGLTLPDSVKMRGKVGKAPLRWWAARRLPTEHINRKKRGFHVPTGVILTDEFVSALGQKLRHHPTVKEWFSAPGLERLVRSAPSPHRNRMLWSLMQFGLWSNLLIEHPRQTPSSDEDPLAWL